MPKRPKRTDPPVEEHAALERLCDPDALAVDGAGVPDGLGPDDEVWDESRDG